MSEILFLIISNFRKQNIEKGKKYKVVFYAKADGAINLNVSFVGTEKGEKLASNNIRYAFQLIRTYRDYIYIVLYKPNRLIIGQLSWQIL